MNNPVLVNVSNHPSSGWGEEQKKAALKLCRWENADGDIIAEGRIVDIAFPKVPASAGTNEVNKIAESLYSAILGVIDPAQSTDDPDCPPPTIHLMGERRRRHNRRRQDIRHSFSGSASDCRDKRNQLDDRVNLLGNLGRY